MATLKGGSVKHIAGASDPSSVATSSVDGRVPAEHAVRPADPEVAGAAHGEGLDRGQLVAVVGAVAGEAERFAAREQLAEVLLEAGVGEVEVQGEQLVELGDQEADRPSPTPRPSGCP